MRRYGAFLVTGLEKLLEKTAGHSRRLNASWFVLRITSFTCDSCLSVVTSSSCGCIGGSVSFCCPSRIGSGWMRSSRSFLSGCSFSCGSGWICSCRPGGIGSCRPSGIGSCWPSGIGSCRPGRIGSCRPGGMGSCLIMGRRLGWISSGCRTRGRCVATTRHVGWVVAKGGGRVEEESIRAGKTLHSCIWRTRVGAVEVEATIRVWVTTWFGARTLYVHPTCNREENYVTLGYLRQLGKVGKV